MKERTEDMTEEHESGVLMYPVRANVTRYHAHPRARSNPIIELNDHKNKISVSVLRPPEAVTDHSGTARWRLTDLIIELYYHEYHHRRRHHHHVHHAHHRHHHHHHYLILSIIAITISYVVTVSVARDGTERAHLDSPITFISGRLQGTGGSADNYPSRYVAEHSSKHHLLFTQICFDKGASPIFVRRFPFQE
ncbi:hypothetical protein E2C01_046856 [Portunus trituberculatus]|uniref:Uncharacterized protein n=1 Tax=Portunus trituberculatus TaxID=210409 RepID=A0A5B7G8W4_PORTR|nr:hypothetical protein [Portunus trituberculatus]